MFISLWRWVIVYMGGIGGEYPHSYYEFRLDEIVQELRSADISVHQFFIEVDGANVYAHVHVPMGKRTITRELIEEAVQ